MHLPDGVLNAPVAIGTAAVSASALAVALRRFQKRTGEGNRLIPVLGILSAFVFAAQMINFPIPAGTSGHLMGSALAAVFVGPAGAILTLTMVLIVQCFLYADGGVTALGANIFNMAVVGGLTGYLAYRMILGRSTARSRVLIAAGVGAWLSIVIAAFACAAELAMSGTVPARAVVPAMVSVHMIIGIGEAVITVAVVGYVLSVRPRLVAAGRELTGPIRLSRREITVAVTICLAIAVILSSFASASPDGLEKVAERLGFAHAADTGSRLPAPMPDYGLPATGDGFLGTALAGGAGVLIFVILGWIFYRRIGLEPS